MLIKIFHFFGQKTQLFFVESTEYAVMADKYDISRNPSDLPGSHGIANVRAGASRQYFLSFDDARTQKESAHRQLTAYVWKQSMR